MTNNEREAVLAAVVELMVLALVVLLAFLTGCQRGVPLAPKPDVYADVKAATVSIVRYCGDVSDATGTGIAVTKREVITVGHMTVCAKGDLAMSISFTDGKAYKMRVAKSLVLPNMIGTYPDGWALLTMVNDGGFDEPIVKPTIAFPKAGENICQVHAQPTRGIECGSVTALSEEKPTFSFTLAVQPGNSGSPIVDSNGKLVGFVVDCLSNDKGCYPKGGDALISFGAVLL